MSITVDGNRLQAAESEKELLAVLASDAGTFDKAKACQQLAVAGTAKSVPALAKLLEDEKLAHYARFALEPIPARAVDRALRAALEELEGALRIGVINSIGVRRDAGALPQLRELLEADDARLAAAAAAAVGRIGNAKAARTLRRALRGDREELRRAVADACLQCAEILAAEGKPKVAVELYDAVRTSELPSHIRMAGLRGAILARGDEGVPLLTAQLKGEDEEAFELALMVVREAPASGATAAVVETLDVLPAERKALVLRALGDRGDRSALPAVIAALGEPREARRAAIIALRQLGDATAIDALLDVAVAAQAEVAEAARVTLSELEGDAVDKHLVAALQESAGARRAALIDVVGRRRIRAAAAALREAARSGDGAIRVAAVGALGRLARLEDLEFLAKRALAAESRLEGDAFLGALSMACAANPDPQASTRILVGVVDDAPPADRCRLLAVFNDIGGADALAAVKARARDENEAVRECAADVLGEWRSPDAATALLDLARRASDAQERVRFLRAVTHLIRRLGFPKEQRLARCAEAMEIAATTDERKLALHAYAGIPAPETLKILEGYYDDEALREAACAASVTIAERLLRSRRSDAARAMKAVLEATRNDEIRARARQLYRQAGGSNE